MNTNKLKTFARSARTKLMSDVGAKLSWVLSHKDDNAELLGNRRGDVAKLEERITAVGTAQVIDEVAYTWFNRLVALRFMDANGYNIPCVVTPAEGMSLPEILQDAKSGHIDDRFNVERSKISDILDGKVLATSGNPESDVYRMLLVSACNSWNCAMPFMFEQLNSYTDLLLSDNLLGENSIVTIVREGMSVDNCQQEELIGWLYQFYIAELKEEVEPNKSSKTGLKAEEIPAATQLFTPHWIVRYMVENSLGRIWMTLHPDSPLKKQMTYYIDEVEGQTSPIPADVKSTKDIRFIDPCMGSGHVLVYAFELLCKMYEEEGYSNSEIPTLIFKNNLFGIDIDPRCSQLANFALTMKAQSYYRRYLRKSVKINAIALSNVTNDVIESCGDFDSTSAVYLLSQANNLGSLISITESDYNKIATTDGGLFSVNSDKLKEMALLLSQKYHCVVTNPPYLGKGMNVILKSFVTKLYPDSKSDLMATFMERCLDMNTASGYTAMINQHSWMFLSSYVNLRKKIIANSHISSLLHLGPRTFPEIGGEIVQNAAFVLGNFTTEDKGQYVRLVDFSDAVLKDVKCVESIQNRDCGWFYIAEQKNFEKIPGSPIGYWLSEMAISSFDNPKISDAGISSPGIRTGVDEIFIRFWQEVGFETLKTNSKSVVNLTTSAKWYPITRGGEYNRWYGNLFHIVNAENNFQEVKFKCPDYRLRDESLYFKEGITWTMISSSKPSFRICPEGVLFGNGGPTLYIENILYILAFLNSKVTRLFLSLLNPTLNFTKSDIDKLPLITMNNDTVSELSLINRNISKQDWDAHETSWEFKQNELVKFHKLCENEENRLEFLYNEYELVWKDNFLQLHHNEEELNRQFIGIYGLQDELTPDVPLKEITILQQGEIKIEDNEIVFQPAVVLKQFMSYAVGCMMGRYSIDEAGLILANQGEGVAEYLEKIPNPTFMPDDDGIIPVLEGEYFLDDLTERFKQFMSTAIGDQNSSENLNFILSHVGDIRKYFYKDFYNDHVKMYKKRPIYWMFSSPKKHFQVLVYMHRMRSDTPSKVFNDYLQPYIHKLEAERHTQQNELLRADITPREKISATKREIDLSKMLLDCEEYAKTLLAFASTRLTIDLDDGVKVNYTKFKGIVTKIVGLE